VSAQLQESDVVGYQALRRELNERISSINTLGLGAAGSITVMCECVRTNCTASIAMTGREYETVRRFPTRFFVKEGHEVADEERVVAEAVDYIVIEAFGRKGINAVRASRRRGLRSVGVAT
jgi:hypothetical protein